MVSGVEACLILFWFFNNKNYDTTKINKGK